MRLQPFEYLPFATSPKSINGYTSWGRKTNFNSSIDDPTMASGRWNPVDSRSRKCPRGRLGSVLRTCNRLQRMRGRFFFFLSKYGRAA